MFIYKYESTHARKHIGCIFLDIAKFIYSYFGKPELPMAGKIPEIAYVEKISIFAEVLMVEEFQNLSRLEIYEQFYGIFFNTTGK